MLERDGNTVYLGGERAIWIENRQLHFDIEVYARAFDLSVEEAKAELADVCAQFYPGVPIMESKDKPR